MEIHAFTPRSLLQRDRALTRGWKGRLLVAVTLPAIPVGMLVRSAQVGAYADDSWKALVMAAALAVGYLVSRRLVLTAVLAVLAVSVTSWAVRPNLSASATGDPTVLAQLEQERSSGMLAGLADVAVVQIDLAAPQPVRLAGLGATDETPMELGSVTKAMTGLVLADAVHRGEVRMDVPVSDYLPGLSGSPAGTVTLHELVTHTAGYADFGVDTLARGAWSGPIGRNFVTADAAQLLREVRGQNLVGRGSWRYSSLGAATAGQAAAAAAGMSYPDLMRTRLFEPLGMTHTAIQTGHPLVTGGTSQTGLPVQPWVFDAYAPAGAAVSTTGDLAKLATALLNGTAPGIAALDPTTSAFSTGSSVGTFWITSAWPNGQTVTWHAGQTGGYSAYLALDHTHRTATVVLSDVATAATTALGADLLTTND